MNKTKKNGFLKVAGIMAVIVMLTTCIVSGTVAKYTSTGTAGFNPVTPASWEIKLNDSTELTTGVTDLTWTIKAINTETGELHVADGKIAPGTWGYAKVKVTNNGEVDAALTLTGLDSIADKGNGSSNLSFKFVAMDEDPTSYSEANGNTSNITLAQKTSKTFYVCYEWVYDEDGTHDAEDTNLGTNQAEISFDNLTITATQVEPQTKAE